MEVRLAPQQVELLSRLMEASDAAREEFRVLRASGGMFLRHPGLPDGNLDVYEPDFQGLEDLGFFTVTHYGSQDGKSTTFDISPVGRHAYSVLHTESVSPSEAVVQEMQRFVDSDLFRKRYPVAHDCWTKAAKLLWAEDSRGKLTDVGHYCREALQEFAAVLVQGLPVAQETKSTETVERLRAVLAAACKRLGDKTSKMLDAMLSYWGTVSDLVQRQVHAAEREGEDLRWEDARRVVFQTLVVMYEIDRAVGRD